MKYSEFPKIYVVFNRQRLKTKSGLYPLHFRIYFRKKTDYVRVQVPHIPPTDWIGDRDNSLFVEDPAMNREIVDQLTAIRGWCHEQLKAERYLCVSTIRKHFTHKANLQSFNHWAHRYVNTMNKGKTEDERKSYGTIQVYRSFLVRLDEFNPDIAFDEITPDLVKAFDRYLASTHKIKNNTRIKHLKKWKVLYKEACKEGFMIYDPLFFDHIHIREQRPERVSLTMEELRKLKTTLMPTEDLEQYKQIYFFSALTGLYFSDVKQLKQENIQHQEVEGKEVYFIRGSRIKNGEEFLIPLFEDALNILDAYSNWKAPDQDIPLFDNLISDQKYNKKLKDIAKELEINKNLTNRTARHTYAEMMLSMGVPLEKIGAALGHRKNTTTQIYAKLSITSQMKDFKDFEI